MGSCARLGASSLGLAGLALCLRPARVEEEGTKLRRYLRLAADVAGVPVHLSVAVVSEALRMAGETSLGDTHEAAD